MDPRLIAIEVKRINDHLASLTGFHAQITKKIERLEEERRFWLEQLEYKP